jgi:alkanesulfonate monooxygenase SsuD/methylene tetrahydromethanopterin reductase-like flavin-dependent oxidoreductase (luciferase family)
VTNVQLGFCMPAEFLRMPARATVMDALDHALNLVAGHFHGAWIVDHLQSGDAALLEGFTALTYLAARHPRLTFGHAAFEGTHYRVREARCEPRPDPLPPVMVGAFRPKMLRLVARYAD